MAQRTRIRDEIEERSECEPYRRLGLLSVTSVLSVVAFHQNQSEEKPLTLALSPQSRGEGTKPKAADKATP